MAESGWIEIPEARRSYCKFCLELVYWKPTAPRTDPYGNLIHDPPREARLNAGGTIEYRDVPHKCKRRSI